MDASLMARMKELEEENQLLRKMYIEERLKAEIVAEALTKNGSTILAAGDGAMSRDFDISQTCYRYKAKLDAKNNLIADWLGRLTSNQRNWGFSLCFLYLRNVKILVPVFRFYPD
jgi:putative transposase